MKTFTAIMLAAGLLVSASAMAQTTAQKQPTQEGGASSPLPCAKPFNANPAADPDCGYKQQTQTLTPSSAQPSPTSK